MNRFPVMKLRSLNSSGLTKRCSSRRQHVHEEQIEGDERDRRFDPDLGRAEPVLDLPAIEQQLKRPDADAERRESEEIEARFADCRLRHEAQHPEESEDAEWYVDEEHPAPVVILGQPAAERGSHDGSEAGRHRPHRHGPGLTFRRVDVEQHGLGQRHQRGPAKALQQPGQHDLGQRLRQSAEHGRDGETGDRNKENPFAADAAGQPTARAES